MAETSGVAYEDAFDLSRTLTNAFSALKRAFPVLFVGGCLKSCTEGGGGGGGNSAQDLEALGELFNSSGDAQAPQFLQPTIQSWLPPSLQSGNPLEMLGIGGAETAMLGGVFVVVMLVVVVAVLLVMMLTAWIQPGWIRVHEQILRRGEGEWATLFGAFDRFLPMLGWTALEMVLGFATLGIAMGPWAGIFFADDAQKLLASVVLGGWSLLVVLVSAWAWLGLFFVPHCITLENRPVFDAVERSWELANGNRIWMCVFGVVRGVVSFVITAVGLCFCIVGVYATRSIGIAVRDISFTEGFLRYTRPPEEIATWNVREWGEA